MSAPTCSAAGCSKPGNMMCPKCKKLGIPGSYFCGQECFKAGWDAHKQLHKMFKKALKSQATKVATGKGTRRRVPTGFEGYVYTGPLRVGNVSEQMQVPAHIKKPDYALHMTGASESEEKEKHSRVIHVADAAEIEAMRKAGKVAREVMDCAREALRAGVTGDDIDKVVFEATVSRGAYPSPLNYYLFPKSVCVSPNEVICHGIPDDRVIEDGDIVNLDVTVYIHGVHSDMNETFYIGDVDEDSKMLTQTAFNCLKNAVDLVKPGTMYRELGKVISRTARKAGCSVVTTYCGHGCNTLFHCAPSVPHYAKNKAIGVMKPGHVFTIEPMINRGGSGDKTWPDNWTAVTRDGKRSAQFEHSILVTEDGYELLTARFGQPKMVWDEEYTQRPGTGGDESKTADAPAPAAAAGGDEAKE